jgi:YggT family protein
MLGLFCFLLNGAVSIYVWIVIIAVLMTYFQPNPYNPAVQFIYRVTEPLFGYARKYLSFLIISGIDFSPVAIILLLQFIPQLICSALW